MSTIIRTGCSATPTGGTAKEQGRHDRHQADHEYGREEYRAVEHPAEEPAYRRLVALVGARCAAPPSREQIPTFEPAISPFSQPAPVTGWRRLTIKVRRKKLVKQTFVSLAEARQTDGLLV